MKNKNAFTLVELIVTISILAILATLWALSFLWYQVDARNTKRGTDLKNLHSKIETSLLQWLDLNKTLSETGSTLSGVNISFWGFLWSTNLPWKYAAWEIDYGAIGVVRDEFLDPKFNVPYVLWYSTFLKKYQLAATVENQAGEYDIISSWNYGARKSNVVRANRSSISWNIFYAVEWDLKTLWFKVWDNVWISATGEYIIKRISWSKAYLDRTVTTPWATMFLKNNESRYIIKKWDSNFPIDTKRGYKYTPYYSN